GNQQYIMLDHFGRFAADLAHEVRGTLRLVDGQLSTLQETLPETPATQKQTSLIRKELNRLEQIVKDFLKVARPADPRHRVQIGAGSLLKELKELLAPQYEPQSIQLKLDSIVE